MENNVEEYLKAFKPEKLELIVRVSWCWGKGGAALIDNYYKGQARFDKALNVRTGELIGNEVAFNWIEWLAPKKIFGFKYGYKFKKGNMYRILVREYIPKKDDKFRKYYLEQVLEQNVYEPLLDPLYNFESKYEERTTDMIVLIKRRSYGGWAIEQKYRIPGVTFIASIDYNTNELSQAYGRLTWMEKCGNSKLKFNLDGMKAYLVRVRKSKDDSNSYMLLNVLRKVKDDRLERIKEEYLRPVVISNKLGEFRLNREYDYFEGQIDYLGETCCVHLEVEEGETTADIQLNKLDEIFSNLVNWDKDVKAYASNELLELANEWLLSEMDGTEEETEITGEEFSQRIGVPLIIIYGNRAVELMFDSDNMFTDHSIVIDIDENGDFISADIWG